MLNNISLSDLLWLAVPATIVFFVVHMIFKIGKKVTQTGNIQTDQKQNMFNKSVWFWWIFTTCIYLVIGFFQFPANQVGLSTYLTHIQGFVGLFVPFGMQSFTLLLVSPFSWFSLIIFLASMAYTESFLKKQNYNFRKRILINLLILLVLTFVVDIIRGTPFASWMIFLNGRFPTF